MIKQVQRMLTLAEQLNPSILMRDPVWLEERATGFQIMVKEIYKYKSRWVWRVEYFSGPQTRHEWPNKHMTAARFKLLGRRRQETGPDGRRIDKFSILGACKND